MLKAVVLFPLSVSFNSRPAPAKTSLIISFSLCSFHAFIISFFSHLSIAFYSFFPLVNIFFPPLPSSLPPLLFANLFLLSLLSFPGGVFWGGLRSDFLPVSSPSFSRRAVCLVWWIITSNGTNQLALPPPKVLLPPGGQMSSSLDFSKKRPFPDILA